MSGFHEIGSEYWKADRGSEAGQPIPGAVYAASGRSAQSLIVASAGVENHRALLPAYTCQHITERRFENDRLPADLLAEKNTPAVTLPRPELAPGGLL